MARDDGYRVVERRSRRRCRRGGESNGKLHLLELNSFSCSGLYVCDWAAVIHAASAAAENEWNAQNATRNTRG